MTRKQDYPTQLKPQPGFKTTPRDLPRYGGRRVSEDILNTVLGKDKTVNALRTKGGRNEIQKKSVLKAGRKDAGMRNPRGGRNLSQDMPTQMSGAVGTHPEDAAQTDVQRDVISRILGNENKKKYDRAELLKKIEADAAKKKAKKTKDGQPAMYKSRKQQADDQADGEISDQ